MDIVLKDFEGPLDLLLHLVSKYEMDIYDVPITEVIEQYLAYLAGLQAMKLEIAGEYMVMASQLMLIKSRKLIPKVVEETPIEEDLEQELLSQIEEYRQFKQLSQELSKQHDERAKRHSKPKLEIVNEHTVLNNDKTVIDLFLAFSQVMEKRQDQLRAENTVIEADDVKIEDMMVRMEDVLERQPRLVFNQLLMECQTKNEMITLFLATLELIKRHHIVVVQESNFSDILLIKE